MSLLEEWNLKDAVAVAKRDGRKMGREMGERKRTMEIAQKMKDKGKSIDEIIEMTGLTVDDILLL